MSYQLDLSSSDLIALLALAVSVASAVYSKRQSEIASEAKFNDYRAHLSANHERYRVLLKEIRARHQPRVRALMHLADEALRDVVHMLDGFEIGACESQSSTEYARPLRHLLHESSEMLFYAFKGQLAWQTGLHMQFRLGHLRHLEDHLDEFEPNRSVKLSGDFRRECSSAYFKDPNAYLEHVVLGQRHFQHMISGMRRRIDAARAPDLMIRMGQSIAPVEEALGVLREELFQSVSALQSALDENELEEFSLRESPNIFGKLARTKSKYDVLSHFRFMEIPAQDAHHYRNYVSILVFTCVILHAIQQFDDWGWSSG